jgi:hypothetical protein
MANELTNSTVISKSNSGFPPYLDFDTLRAGAIEYLGNLTGKLWTDYNVHDPGITILEMLIYAVIDLGYRTNLPAIDIFTKNPEDNSSENNFFTAKEILSCNPLTITDFRKLLIDIDGVKNAWLTVATDVNLNSICNEPTSPATINQDDNTAQCTSYINGLYHICIEKDDSSLREEAEMLDDIRAALQAHRNLCEDFIDIAILCPLDIGVYADIELEANTDAEEVYRNVIVSLKEFFSPSPRFYTLQQLLDKQKPIEDIFAGRPYNYSQSHGFVDTDEFEAIVLKDEIHLSDVYNVILNIDGVKTVRRLKLKKRGEDFIDVWQFKLTHNYVPDFLPELSYFKFSINGIYQAVDLQKSNAYLKITSGNTAKLIQPDAALNLEIPRSVYRNDLADYYSIQNEFPLVYGIGEVGLPESALPQRKAQALQLKAYLLFFDQMLAGYLLQLKNMRSLFSFRQPDTDHEHTYFTNAVSNVPGFSALITNIAEKGVSSSGSNGTILALPVWKKDFDNLLQQQYCSSADIENLQQQFNCKTKEQCDIIINLLQNDFCNGLFSSPVSKATSDNFHFSYISFNDEDIVVTGKCFTNKSDSEKAMQMLPYFASLAASYESYSDGGLFVFNIQLNLPTYMEFLQTLTESKDVYNARRDAFLNHLLARFAEQFTDYAMLSYGFLEKNKLAGEIIKNKEAFLSQYPLLSSTRGKAFDYRTPANDTENLSGFEQRFKAYAGIQNNSSNSLCNFEVAAYENTYSVQLKIAGFHLFDTPKSYEGYDKAQAAAQAIFKSIAAAASYEIKYVPYEEKHQLQLLYNNNEVAYYPLLFNTKEEAERISHNLQKLFTTAIADEDIIVSGFEYRLQLKNSNGDVVRLSVDAFENTDAAFAAAISFLKTPSDTTKWQIVMPEDSPSGKFCFKNKKKPEKLVDISHFKIDINNNIVGKPDKYSYELLDKENTFKIRSLKEFNNENQARTDCYRLLLLMTDIENYHLINENNRYHIFISENEQPDAECVSSFDSEAKAIDFRNKIHGIVYSHYYTLLALAFPSRWKFSYKLGFENSLTLLFVSDDEFTSIEAVREAAEKFNASLPSLNLEVINYKYSLKTPDNATGTLTCTNAGEDIIKEDNDTKLNQVRSFLTLKQQINERLLANEGKPFEEGIAIDEISKSGQYVYRLVDKDRLLAQHPIAAGANAKEILNDLYNTALAGYAVLSVCLGGDVTEVYIDPKTNAFWYRYVIRFNRAFGLFKRDTILFKSVAAYASVDDAENAFNANYLLILSNAMDENNYGTGKYISVEELKANIKTEAIVFIPLDTQTIITNANADVIKTFVQTARSYPIKIHRKSSVNQNAANNNAPYVYYFVLYNSRTDSNDWQSVRYYDELINARKDFSFFIMLLQYKGNYFTDKDYCKKETIYIREVLAESTSRFKNELDEPDAWGIKGVEKFICIAQSAGAFQATLNENNCSCNFNVSCNNANAIHPCKYNTPEKRDEVIENLYKSFKALDVDKLFRIITEESKQLIYATNGKPVAILSTKNLPQDEINAKDCERLMTLFELAVDNKNYKNIDGKISLVKVEDANTYTKLAEPTDDTMTQEDWKKQLLDLAYYYPIKEKDKKYCVEIRLPGFNTMRDNKPCDCHNENLDNEDDCYVAWQSACCFDTCDEAMQKYSKILVVLTDYKNYHTYFDCECYAFGIALLSSADIIAYNPQRYSTPDMVCDAIERSKKLINSEGLRLVEHILLRPRCKEDCNCKYEGRVYENVTNCHDLFWTEEAIEKGQETEKRICFKPGLDPYSFVATAILPAWPERFRKKENRDLLETILTREIPSHILLRILWLKPEDICTFETLYKDWKWWLLQKEDCNRSSVLCELKEFLFLNKFFCLNECTDCLPCQESITDTNFLADSAPTKKSANAYKILEDINKIFGWQEFSCATMEKGITGNLINTAVPATLQSQITSDAGTKPLENKEMTPEEAELLRKDKVRLLNKRLSDYKANIQRIYEDSNSNPTVEKALRVFGEEHLEDKINGILNELLSNQNLPDGNQVIQQSQRDEVCKILIWLYIDRTVFGENDVSKLYLISDGLDKLRQSNFDMQALFTGWKPEAFEKYETSENTEAVHNIILNG